MFVDARVLDESAVLKGTVCVIGAGVAGILMALEFERRGIDTLLLESGGFTPDEATRDLYRGENVGIPYVFADGCRSRFLGGSSNCWGGWCGPLQEHDFIRRDWIADSGWPFDRQALRPYYERAHPLLNLGPVDYDMASWVAAIGRADVRRIPLRSGQVRDILSQFSSPSRLGSVYRQTLARALHVRTVLHANVTQIETDPAGVAVQRVQVRTLGGRRFVVEAGRFVLACGGIENARLLLASNTTVPAGLGNANDLVGRYFADHPRLSLGSVKLHPDWRRNKLYDIKYHYLNRAVSAKGTYVSSQFSIDPGIQRREGLLNALVWFASEFAGENTGAAEALIRMKHRFHGKASIDVGFWSDLAQLVSAPVSTASFAAARLFQPESLIKRVKLEIVCEASPERDSRVTLSDQRDALDMPRVRVDWRVGSQVLHTMDRTLAIFADELRQAGVAEIELPEPMARTGLPPVASSPWLNLGCWHHMGTTRMHDSPLQGVVDPDCKVHGLDNLYVAGSSVFPTYGANFPTITIAALALRLSDHITDQLADRLVAHPGDRAAGRAPA